MNRSSFQDLIEYHFKDGELLSNAFTHSSFSHETGKGHSNERLEFLGDAIFDAVIGEILYRKLPDYEEGKLSKLRAIIVCEGSLAHAGKQLKVPDLLIFGKGEEHCGGRQRDSIIADAVEAVIGAIFLDGGYEAAKQFIGSIFKETIEEAVSGKLAGDYKTALQEYFQKNGQACIEYKIDKTQGPEHDKTFYVSLYVNEKLLGKGRGKNKKEAEQQAAKSAIKGGAIDVF